MFHLGEWEVDPATRRVSRGSQEVRLSPKAMGVLTGLHAAEGQVLSRTELLDLVWPNVTVGDEVLTHAIAEIRKALGDSSRNPRYLETVHKGGYRLLDPAPLDGAAGEERAAPQPSPPDPEPADDSAGQAVVFPMGREHKQVSVLDCALSDAAMLAGRLGAEAMAETVERLHLAAQDIISRYEGAVTQWSGDGLIALFGAPHALEDHPRRALGAALELLRCFEQDGGEEGGSARVSIGIHTGPAVVGLREGGSREIFTALGVTTETARQLRCEAPPAVLLASEATCALLGSEVEAQPFTLQGEDAAKAFRVQGFTQRRSGVPRRRRPRLSRFVGRQRELDMLLTRIGSLEAMGGEVIDIVGDPGIGKSRLTEELEAALAGSKVQLWRTHCLPHGRASPYLPLAGLLREICAAGAESDDEDIAGRLAVRLTALGSDEAAVRSLLLQMLGLPFDAKALAKLTPEEKQRRTFEGLHHLVALAAERAPLVLLIEDLHWIDATSEAWLAQQALRLAGMPVLLLATHRPSYHPPWQSRSTASRIALPGLAPSDSRALVLSVPRTPQLSGAALDSLVARAQGNPFFLEELAVSLASESADAGLVPDSVQAVIAARIDRLPSAQKRLLQIAAVIGSRIPLGLLARIDGLEASSRRDSLLDLQQAELIYERRSTPEPVFAFKHALTQEVAYVGLVATARRAVHQDIADVLLRDFPDLLVERPEIVARHLTEAGRPREAIAYWQVAGRQASALATGIEAIGHFEKALALAEQDTEENGRASIKLAILLDLGLALQAVRGAGAAEVGEIYQRARALSRQISQERDGFVALWGLWRHELLNQELKAEGALADELLALAAESADDELDLQARHAAWSTACFTGSLDQALVHAEAGLALDAPQAHTAPHYPFGGHDPICCARCTLALVLGLQGKPDSAKRQVAAAIELARRLEHRPTFADVYLQATDLYLFLRDRQALAVTAQDLRLLGEELGFAMHSDIARFSLAWCRFKESGDREALTAMRESLASAKRTGGIGRGLYHDAAFADCLADAGRHEEARGLIEQSVEDASRLREDHRAMAEAHRVLGEVLHRAKTGEDEIAEQHFEAARAIARRQGALIFELRAACSLARLWQSQGRAEEAQSLLWPLYGRFEEGFDSADLREARRLLDRLA